MSVATFRRVQRHARHHGERSGSVVVRIRPRAPVPPDMYVRYPHDVSERKIDRDAWARIVAELITDECAGNKSEFARLVGVGHKTVTRWLLGQVNVSEEKVRDVAHAFDRPTREILVTIGYYSADELPGRDLTGEPELTEDDIDDEIARIEAEDFKPRVKRRIIQGIREMREQQAESILKIRAEQAEQRRRMIDLLIRQAKGA